MSTGVWPPIVGTDHDIIPVEIADHVGTAIPDAELVTLKDCGHFSYLEALDNVRDALGRFLVRMTPPAADDPADGEGRRHDRRS